MRRLGIAVLLLAAAALAAAAEEGEAYTPVGPLEGSLTCVGSDTLSVIVTYWAEGFQELYPKVQIGIESKGSATAPPALTDGTAQIGPMSRPMNQQEIAAFTARHGHPPTAITVAIDALSVFVHPDNPITGLSLAQLDAVFGGERRRGGEAARTWGDLGLGGTLHGATITAYGRNPYSGSYQFFMDTVLRGGKYRDAVKQLPGSSAVVAAVADDPAGIGYAGIGYTSQRVRLLPVHNGTEFVPPTREHALDGSYPLARPLFLCIDAAPGRPLPPLVHEFLRFVLSAQGQRLIEKEGFFPLPAEALGRSREALTPAESPRP
jgi:phosphate transport system substrate-binding protein